MKRTTRNQSRTDLESLPHTTEVSDDNVENAGLADDQAVCPACEVVVHVKDKALACDICNYWIHARCEKISEEVYKVINDSNLLGIIGMGWTCSACRRGAKSLRDQVCVMKKNMDDEFAKLKTFQSNTQERLTRLEAKETNEDTVEKVLDELRDRQNRGNNIIIFGLDESKEDSPLDRNRDDTREFLTICKGTLQLEENETIIPVNSYRLKSKNEEGPRPLRVRLKNQEATGVVLSAWAQVPMKKKMEMPMSMRKDYTLQERETRRKLLIQKKEKQSELEAEGDQEHVWVVTRENRLVKIKKS